MCRARARGTERSGAKREASGRGKKGRGGARAKQERKDSPSSQASTKKKTVRIQPLYALDAMTPSLLTNWRMERVKKKAPVFFLLFSERRGGSADGA